MIGTGGKRGIPKPEIRIPKELRRPKTENSDWARREHDQWLRGQSGQRVSLTTNRGLIDISVHQCLSVVVLRFLAK
jgi:hypothetical protein